MAPPLHPPPPVTPSPHRFVIKKPPEPPPSQQDTPLPASQRFNPTPRFSFGPSQGRTLPRTQPLSSTPNVTRFSTSARQIEITSDSIEEASDQPDLNVYDSIETNEHFFESQDSIGEDEGSHYEPRESKRRRLSTPIDITGAFARVDDYDNNGDHDKAHNLDDEDENQFEDILISSNPIVSSPVSRQAQRPPLSANAPRFVVPTTPGPLPPSTPSDPSTASAFQRPPRFRPPNGHNQQQPAAEPLPEAFSPHRRGQKYVAGGLAAELIGWLVNLENKASDHLRIDAKGETEPIKIIVEDLSGSTRMGMTLLRGKQINLGLNLQRGYVVDDLGVVKMALAGSGTGTGIERGGKVEVGNMIGIKPPTWEVVVEGETWRVAVDWKVLDDGSTR